MPGDDEEVRRKAYELWEEEGRPEGKHEEHWRKAHEKIRGIAPMPEGGAEAGTTDVSAHDAPEDFDDQDKAMIPENGAENLTETTPPEGGDAAPAQKKVRTRRKATPAG